MALDDRGTIHAAWKRAERPTALTSEPGQAEGVGDLARRVANEERRLEAERGELDNAPRTELELLRVRELLLEAIDRSVQSLVDAGGELGLGRNGRDPQRH